MTVCHKEDKDLIYKTMNNKKTNVKCVVVGDAMVGKTSLARRLAGLGFAPDYNPTTFDNYAGELCSSSLVSVTSVSVMFVEGCHIWSQSDSDSGMVGLAPKWVRLAPNAPNPGLFSDQISVHLAWGAKCTEI